MRNPASVTNATGSSAAGELASSFPATLPLAMRSDTGSRICGVHQDGDFTLWTGSFLAKEEDDE
jgi:hypothetical protein